MDNHSKPPSKSPLWQKLLIESLLARTAILIVDKDCRILYCSDGMRSLLPVLPDEAIGHHIDDFGLDPRLKRTVKKHYSETSSIYLRDFIDYAKLLEKKVKIERDFLYPPLPESTPVMYVYRHPLLDGNEVVGAYALYEFAWEHEPSEPLRLGGFRAGHKAYTAKPLKPIPPLLTKAIRRLNAGGLLPEIPDGTFDSIIGNSPQIREIKEILAKVSPSASTVLITGESGTGKELLARAIYANSNRATKPFIAINCSAIPESLFETELFGYEGGTFTGGLQKGKAGKLEAANEGTVFLDEIGEMPLFMQAKLLRVLQEREIVRVGGVKPTPLNVRVIAATNRDLKKMVEEGTFREDLYYRINVIRINIPPLRERKEDIPQLVQHYVSVFNKILGSNVTRVSPQVMSMLIDQNWPGNIRELCNVIEAGMTFCTASTLEIQDFAYCKDHLNVYNAAEEDAPSQNNFNDNQDKTENAHCGEVLRSYVNNAEKERILSCLKKNNGDKTKTAQQLNISRATLYRKIKQLGLND